MTGTSHSDSSQIAAATTASQKMSLTAARTSFEGSFTYMGGEGTKFTPLVQGLSESHLSVTSTIQRFG